MKLQIIISTIALFFLGKQASGQQPQLVLPIPMEATAFIPGITSFDLADLTGDSLVLGYLQMGTQNNERQEYNQVYRRGSIFTPKGAGITLGRNVVTKLTGNTDYDRYLTP